MILVNNWSINMLNNDTKNYLKTMAMQVGAGGSAGFIEVCLMHPLDIVKTRLQIQTIKAKNYNGIIDCIQKMYKREGVLSFYKGILPPIIAETPKRATKFLTFEQYKQFFLFGSPVPTPLTYSLAGLSAGVTEAILVNPFESIKVSLQSNLSIAKNAPSTWQVTRNIIQTQGYGIRGLNKGVDATIIRNGVFNMVYFGFYNSVKDAIPQSEDGTREFFRKLLIGFTSGVLATLCNTPFDVAKSRIQGPQPDNTGQIKYKYTIPTIRIVYREEGFKALYKGLLPKVLRLGPGGAIMMLGFEYVYEFLKEKFPLTS